MLEVLKGMNRSATVASRLASLLTVLSAMITTLLATYIVVGPGWNAGLTVVSLLALAAWPRLTWRAPAGHEAIGSLSTAMAVKVAARRTPALGNEFEKA